MQEQGLSFDILAHYRSRSPLLTMQSYGSMHRHLNAHHVHKPPLSAYRPGCRTYFAEPRKRHQVSGRPCRPRCLEVHSQKRNNDPFNFERDMKDMFSKDNFGKNMFNRGSANSSMFDNSNDYFGDAKKLYAEGERMFRNGQFQQGQRLFQEAEQQLRQAKSKLPFPPFDSRKADYNSPTDPISNKKTWKASSLAVLGIGALAALVAGPLIAAFLATAVALGIAAMSLAALSFIWVIPVAGLLFWFANLFVFPLALTVVRFLTLPSQVLPHTYAACLTGLTVGGLGIGAAAVSAFRGFLRKQPGPVTAQTVTQGTAGETDEQRQQRLYEEESRRLANELREFDAQLESEDENDYKRKLKREGLWRD